MSIKRGAEPKSSKQDSSTSENLVWQAKDLDSHVLMLRIWEGNKNSQRGARSCHHFAVRIMFIENGSLQTKYIYVENLCNAKDPFCPCVAGVNKTNCVASLGPQHVDRGHGCHMLWAEVLEVWPLSSPVSMMCAITQHSVVCILPP